MPLKGWPCLKSLMTDGKMATETDGQDNTDAILSPGI